ncbi:alpha-amylase/alpha-mannosidase (GH57 family) [Thiogranum longum]|uniref:Alpha-amylase/alpha-mannosidase (GH57 family) n=1 Tax=Thiogranum longum TaxID=1537524 RepID=A0A4V2PGZ8_9GAMM|nr:glycoside hydrolase family 57 protein [Thiogranum longum]TCK18806.1 alpha-amylase/alpha-mannosidase (GH57 family) [Thiogranum longum]
MSVKEELRVVLCWHMHQPQYCDLISGEYKLPWTYLHAIKDYVDMAAHIEAVPGAKAVVNFAPVLLEQLDDYVAQVSGYLRDHKAIRDPLLAALVAPVLPTHIQQRAELVNNCLRVNRMRVIDRFPAYKRLASLADHFSKHCDDMVYVGDQFLSDLVFWYHLGWIAETVRRDDIRMQRWQEQGNNFSLHDRRELLVLIGELLSGVIERYALLADRGQVELSMTPYAHPIIPLLLDINSAREAMPDTELPELSAYPGGEERVNWHIREGFNVFEQYFQRKPVGCWPSEGSVSEPTLALLEKHGFRWAASGETVLRNSLRESDGDKAAGAADAVLKGYRVGTGKLACFFRDDNLSDKIGFEYSTWHADDAVANFVHHLEEIAKANAGRKLALPIILDGENAWEHFPENGYYFLRGLYKALATHPTLSLSTFAECLDDDIEIGSLSEMVSGSWVYGTFSTWIGDPDKNRGWDMLGDAKLAFDKACASGNLDSEQVVAAELQLAICEGSDWFWWFGDYNPADSVSDFESLFRLHLSNLYQLIGQEAPEYLAHAFARGTGQPTLGGVMRQGQARD